MSEPGKRGARPREDGTGAIADHDGPLVRRARGGDRAAFRSLVERHHGRVFNIALRMLDNREDAADIVQDTFLSAYRRLKDFEGRARFSTWITTIAMNRCRNIRRSAARARTIALETDPPAPGSASPESETGAREIARHLERALAEIGPEHREVVVLRDIEGLSCRAVAEILGVETGTVKSRLHRARHALRALLEGVWPP